MIGELWGRARVVGSRRCEELRGNGSSSSLDMRIRHDFTVADLSCRTRCHSLITDNMSHDARCVGLVSKARGFIASNRYVLSVGTHMSSPIDGRLSQRM